MVLYLFHPYPCLVGLYHAIVDVQFHVHMSWLFEAWTPRKFPIADMVHGRGAPSTFHGVERWSSKWRNCPHLYPTRLSSACSSSRDCGHSSQHVPKHPDITLCTSCVGLFFYFTVLFHIILFCCFILVLLRLSVHSRKRITCWYYNVDCLLIYVIN